VLLLVSEPTTGTALRSQVQVSACALIVRLAGTWAGGRAVGCARGSGAVCGAPGAHPPAAFGGLAIQLRSLKSGLVLGQKTSLNFVHA
jgi:hypothetical protein